MRHLRDPSHKWEVDHIVGDAIAESRDLIDHLFWRLTQFTLGVGAAGALATILVFRKRKYEATMRKRLPTLGLLWIGLAVAQPATAQFVGITGGATLSDFGAVNSSSRWSGTGGMSFGFRTSYYTVVNLDVSWVRIGGGDIRLDYMDIPLTVGGVASASGGALRIRPYAGIGLGFKIDCSGTTAFANCDNANSTQWTVPLGIMIGRWTRPGTFVALDVRYAISLSDAFATSRAYNRSWQFRLLFGLEGD